MRIMVDANVTVSAILFPKSKVATIFEHLIDNNTLVFSKYTIEEIIDVFNDKFPHKILEMEDFLKNTPYELFELREIIKDKYPYIRDDDDLPVLANAIESKVDILITGDNDFNEVILKNLKIIKPRKYYDEYMQ